VHLKWVKRYVINFKVWS